MILKRFAKFQGSITQRASIPRSSMFLVTLGVVLMILTFISEVGSQTPRLRPGQGQDKRMAPNGFNKNGGLDPQKTTPSTSRYFKSILFDSQGMPDFSSPINEIDHETSYYVVYYNLNRTPYYYEYFETISFPNEDESTENPTSPTLYLIYRSDILPLDQFNKEQYTLGGDQSFRVWQNDQLALGKIVNYTDQPETDNVSSIVYFNRDGRRNRYEVLRSDGWRLVKFYHEGQVAKIDYFNKGLLQYVQLFLYQPETMKLDSVITRSPDRIGQISHRLPSQQVRTDLYDRFGVKKRTFIYNDTNELDTIFLFNEEGNRLHTLPFKDMDRVLMESEKPVEDEASGAPGSGGSTKATNNTKS